MAGSSHAQHGYLDASQFVGAFPPLFAMEPVEQIHQGSNGEFIHPYIAVIPDAGDHDAPFPGGGDVHIGAFFIVESAAHADVPQVGRSLNGFPGDQGVVGDHDAVRILDAANDLGGVLGEVVVKYYFPGKRPQLVFGPIIHTSEVHHNCFLKHTITLSKNSGKYYKILYYKFIRFGKILQPLLLRLSHRKK